MRSSDLERLGQARPRSRPARALPALLALALALAACADEPTRPNSRGGDEDGGRTPRRPLGVVEITISGLGSGHVTSSALSAPTVEALERLRAERDAGAADRSPGSLTPQAFRLPQNSEGAGDGTIQLELLSTGSFTHGERGSGGYRYLYATYRVRNAQADGTAYDTPRKNLTFYAVDTNGTIGQTAISLIERFDGSPADDAIASAFVPTGAVEQDAQDRVVSRFPDVLQVLTETEAAAVKTVANTAGVAVTDVFPWGFVVRNPNDPKSRTLAANPGADQFDGQVTFAFKVPLQASVADDPFTIRAVFLAVDDDQVKLTQAPEEQTPAGRAAFEARAAALGASVFTLLPPAGDAMFRSGAEVRALCDVRVAGSAEHPTATLPPAQTTEPWLTIAPLRGGSYTLPRTVRLGAARCPELLSPGPSTFAVHGSQSGRPGAGAYETVGPGFVRVIAPGGTFFPGEEIEVTLTQALGASKPRVARYRVATSGDLGRFDWVTQLEVGLNVWSVAMGDVDGDGDLDLVMDGAFTGSGYGIAVLSNRGNRNFQLQNSYPLTGQIYSIALGDVDRDGDLDIVVADYSSQQIRVLLNQGNGSFATPGATYTVGSNNPYFVALGDLDGDGDLDVVTANENATNNVSVLLNSGDGTFTLAATYTLGGPSYSVALGDVDGDGDLDLAVPNGAENSNQVWVLLNQGNGSFATPPATYEVGSRPYGVALGDLDGDGDLDLVTGNRTSADVSVRLNNGDGTFGPHVNYAVVNPVQTVVLGDMDGDGDLDVVTGNVSGSVSVGVLFNRGDGSLAAPAKLYNGGGAAKSVALGDLDGDGDLDAIVGNSGTLSMIIRFLWNQRV